MKISLNLCLFVLLIACGTGVGQASAADTKKQVQAAVEFVDLLGKDQFETAAQAFTKQMAEALPAEKLAATWKTLENQVGEYEGRDSTRVEKVQQHEIVFVPCRFKEAVLEAKVVLDGELKIAGLWFAPVK